MIIHNNALRTQGNRHFRPSPQKATEAGKQPTDQVTLGGGDKGAAGLMLGMGVMMTGMMLGAQMDSMGPVVMMGSMFGGLAIMLGSQ